MSTGSYVNPSSLTAFTASRLIALDKCPGRWSEELLRKPFSHWSNIIFRMLLVLFNSVLGSRLVVCWLCMPWKIFLPALIRKASIGWCIQIISTVMPPYWTSNLSAFIFLKYLSIKLCRNMLIYILMEKHFNGTTKGKPNLVHSGCG